MTFATLLPLLVVPVCALFLGMFSYLLNARFNTRSRRIAALSGPHADAVTASNSEVSTRELRAAADDAQQSWRTLYLKLQRARLTNSPP